MALAKLFLCSVLQKLCRPQSMSIFGVGVRTQRSSATLDRELTRRCCRSTLGPNSRSRHAPSNLSMRGLRIGVSLPLLQTFSLLGIAPHVQADELGYQYLYGGQTYLTLAEAEAAMQSAGENYAFLKQYAEQFNSSSGRLLLRYKVPDISAFQVGPTGFTTPGQCVAPTCTSEQAAYAAYTQYLEGLGYCNVTITPQGTWSEEGWGFAPGYTEGQYDPAQHRWTPC